MKVLIAAGGTGGHITPGIAIADMLKSENANIKFVGTERGMEVDLVPKAGYELKIIHARGLKKSISLKNIKAIYDLYKGIKDCENLIDTEKPDIVIGTGGYVTAPLMIAGLRKKIPTMIHESNALPGKTTKWLSKKVDCVALGFEETIKKMPRAKNAIYTGNPTKMNGKIQKEEIRKKLNITKPLILVFGGSQGAKKINEIMIEIINNFNSEEYQIIYATGPKNYDDIISKIKNNNKNIEVKKYIYNMEEIMSASDLVVCRSGALTITELETVGVPAILVPLPTAAENHQYYNAKIIEDNNAGIIIEEKDLNKEILQKTINEFIKNKERLKEITQNAKKKKTENSLKKIREEIEKLIQ